MKEPFTIKSHRTFVHNPDPRAMQVNVLNQDQRSMQVNIGSDPEQVIARESEIMSQAHAAVNAARSQLESETSAMRDQVASMQHEAQSHTQSVVFRASEIVAQMQTQHAKELEHLKQVANEAHGVASEQLNALTKQNELLMKQLQEEEEEEEQQQQQQQLIF